MSDSRHPRPLRDELRDPVDERALPHMWHGIAERRAQRRVAWTPMRVGALVAAAAVVALIARTGLPMTLAPSAELAAAGAHPTEPLDPRIQMAADPTDIVAARADEQVAVTEPLRMAGGAVIGVLEGAAVVTELPAEKAGAVPVQAASARTIAFSDESKVLLAPGARLEPLASTGKLFVTTLQRGRATFDVVPGGPRRWVVEVGGTTIEVLGTRFTVHRDARGVHVSVERGKVAVRGEHVPGRRQELTAGGEVRVDMPGLSAEPPSEDLAERAVFARTPRPRPRSGGAAPTAQWREAADRGDYQGAYDSLGSAGLSHVVEHNRSVRELLQLSDVARLSGHPEQAVEPLRRILDHHGGDRRASLAALSLGRVQLGQLRKPVEAARAFGRAIAMGLPTGLLEDAYARAVEAHVRAGDRGQAEAMAAAYRSRFPDGRRHADIRKWLSPSKR